eukprot:5466235-Amphidinium_carterae.1
MLCQHFGEIAAGHAAIANSPLPSRTEHLGFLQEIVIVPGAPGSEVHQFGSGGVQYAQRGLGNACVGDRRHRKCTLQDLGLIGCQRHSMSGMMREGSGWVCDIPSKAPKT